MTPDAAGIEAALAAGLADHFIMWRDLGQPGQPPGEWFCSCGLKFGFSHTAIAHVAAALLPVVTQAQAEAWDEGYRARSLPNRWNGPRNGFGDPLNPHRARADESGV